MPGNYEEVYAFAAHMQLEHRRLGECLEEIEGKWRQAGVESAELPQLVSGLKTLSVELTRHFREEECGGCLEEAVSRRPSLSAEVMRIEREHVDLLETNRQLIARLRGLPCKWDSLEEVEAEFHQFVETLHDHETAEDQILAEGLGVAPC